MTQRRIERILAHCEHSVPPGGGADAMQVGGALLLAAELLYDKGSPDAGARLVQEHSADDSGHCRGCPHVGSPAPRYPCRLRVIGETVEHLVRTSAPSPARDGAERAAS